MWHCEPVPSLLSVQRSPALPGANKVLVVLGMHRSCTSLVTRWLCAGGLNVGNELLPADGSNVDGYFEDLAFYDLHCAWLKRNQLPPTGYVCRSVPSFDGPSRERLMRIISDRNIRHMEWGWKDPRTCLFLRDYEAVLPIAKYLIVVRDFRATVQSMLFRAARQLDDKYTTARNPKKWLWLRLRRKRALHRLLVERATWFTRVWCFYNRQLLACMHRVGPRRYLVASRESLLRDERSAYERLTRGWGFHLRAVPFASLCRPAGNGWQSALGEWIDRDVLCRAGRMQAALERAEAMQSRD